MSRRTLAQLLGAALASALFCFSTLAQPAVLHGQVQRVIDGDTVVLQDASGQRHTLRLAGIDAPEKRMPFGQAARLQLDALVGGQTITALPTKQDRYGRTVATLHHHGQDVSQWMLATGMAWHYTQYATEQPAWQALAYAQAEQDARTQRRGLWQDASPQAPWVFRQTGATMSIKQ
jgi:endonuclease YncB( thermonuclease family)